MFNKRIFLIFIFAFLIRLIALNQSVWLDEAVTANVVKNFSFLQIITKFSPTDFHPPLYYLFMKLWTNLFGFSEIALRMPSVLFSLATGYVVYMIGGIWAAVFFLFNPLIVYYSQEARMYMMTTFLLTVGLYYLFKSLRVNGLTGYAFKNIILMNIFFTLAFITFYGSVFFIATIFIYFLYKKQYKVFILNTGYFILVTLLIFPLLYQQLINSKIALANVANWSSVLGKSNIKNLLLIPLKFSIGRISFYPKWLYWGITGAWTGFIIYQISKIKNQNDKSKFKMNSLLFYLFLFPLFLVFIISFFIPMLQYFRFLYLIPVMCLLLTINDQKLASYKWTTWISTWILAGGFLIFSLVYLLLPQFHREDWKNLVKNLPKDKPIYTPNSSKDPINYYSNNLIIKDLDSLQIGNKEKQIIVIPYASEIYGIDYKATLIKTGYSLKKEYSFHEVTYEQWAKN